MCEQLTVKRVRLLWQLPPVLLTQRLRVPDAPELHDRLKAVGVQARHAARVTTTRCLDGVLLLPQQLVHVVVRRRRRFVCGRHLAVGESGHKGENNCDVCPRHTRPRRRLCRCHRVCGVLLLLVTSCGQVVFCSF